MEETGAELAVPGETQVALTYELEALATGAPSRGVLRGPWSGDLALGITDPLALESQINQWPGVVTVGIFAHQKAQVCLLGTAQGVKTLNF